MKIVKVLSASLIASALLFGSTGCGSELNVREMNPFAQSAHEKDVDGIIATLNGAMKWPTSERLNQLDAARNTTHLPENERRALIKDTLSEWTNHFAAEDFDTDEDYDYSMNYLTWCIAVWDSGDKEITLDIPRDAIKIDGDTATLDRRQMTVYLDGEEQEAPEYASDEAFYMDFNFVKEDGKWVIKVPEGIDI